MSSLVLALLITFAATADAAAAPASATASRGWSLPSHDGWLSDVSTALEPADRYLKERLAQQGGKPAIVFDIDNTTLETQYRFDLVTIPAVPPSLRLARSAEQRGAAVFFVTGRPEPLRAVTLANLQRVGYPVAGLYLHPTLDLEPVATVKTRARANIEAQGYTIVANIGNRSSDLIGGYAERTFKLPDYFGLLG